MSALMTALFSQSFGRNQSPPEREARKHFPEHCAFEVAERMILHLQDKEQLPEEKHRDQIHPMQHCQYLQKLQQEDLIFSSLSNQKQFSARFEESSPENFFKSKRLIFRNKQQKTSKLLEKRTKKDDELGS